MYRQAMLERFLRDEEGIALAYFAVALPALMGMAMLVIDIGRGNNVHLDLQNAADSLALAAASELDGGSDAIERANRAIENLVGNQGRFGEGGAFIIDQMTVGDVTGEFQVFYLDGIPASDDDPITADFVTNEATEANFAAVWIEPVSYSLMFPVAFLSGDSVSVRASAVAGFRSVVCDFTPMYICNPYASRADLENAVSNIGTRRRLFQMRQAPGDHTQAGGGQYGFLSSPLGNGADKIRDMLASDNPQACFSQDGVELENGQLGNAAASALNVRFDIYDTNMNSKRNKAHYQPAANVRKGHQGTGACPAVDSPVGLGRMPRDTCFATGTCPLLSGHGGNGEWACGTYWANNHGTSPAPAGCDDTPDSSLPSRYDVYLYEIKNGLVGDLAPNGEIGTPTCYNAPAQSTPPSADRRLLYAAIIDCPVTTEPAEVVAYASFFLTEPADKSVSEFWAELVDITGRFGMGTLDGFERDDVQLYR